MRVIPDAQHRELLAWLRRRLTSNRWCQRRDALALLVGLHGLRATEVCNLLRRDFTGMTLKVRTIKRGANREISVGEAMAGELARFLTSHEHAHLLPTRAGKRMRRTWLWQIAVAATAAATGHAFDFHALRHTYAQRLYDETRDPMLVQKALGHKSLQTTLVYLESLKQVPAPFDLAGPLGVTGDASA